jgi:hypothetical protein
LSSNDCQQQKGCVTLASQIGRAQYQYMIKSVGVETFLPVPCAALGIALYSAVMLVGLVVGVMGWHQWLLLKMYAGVLGLVIVASSCGVVSWCFYFVGLYPGGVSVVSPLVARVVLRAGVLAMLAALVLLLCFWTYSVMVSPTVAIVALLAVGFVGVVYGIVGGVLHEVVPIYDASILVILGLEFVMTGLMCWALVAAVSQIHREKINVAEKSRLLRWILVTGKSISLHFCLIVLFFQQL